MNNKSTNQGVLRGLFYLALSCFALLMSGFASAQSQPAKPPAPLRVPDGQTLLFTARAEGVQIYIARAKPGDPATLEWILKGPEADLFDASSAKIGKHYAGPTWEAIDGSTVTGERVGAAPASHVTDVAWLLLKTKSSGGHGLMSDVSYVMRVDTWGGVPASSPLHVGEETRVRYKSTYIFLRAALQPSRSDDLESTISRQNG